MLEQVETPRVHSYDLSHLERIEAFNRRPGARNNRGRIPDGGTVSPLTILGAPSVLAWWRADLGITLNGSNVSAWADQSGNGHHYSQGTAAAQPAYSLTSGPNGTPALTSDGVDDFMAAPTLNLPAPGTTPTFIWVIGYQNTWAAGGPSFVASNVEANTMQIQQGSGVSPQLTVTNPSAVNLNGGLALATWGRGEAHFSNSTNDSLRLRSTFVTGANASNNSSTGRRIFGDPSARFIDGRIAELFYVNRLPTAAERASLDAYASARYGASVLA